MSIKLKQAAQDAAEAIDWLLKNIRFNAPHLSGKAMGNAEKCASALRTAIQQAESEPVGDREALERIASWSEHPAMLGVDYGSNGVRDYYRKIARDVLTHPASGVPEDVVRDAISKVREKYRGTDWGKAAECICDAIDVSIDAPRAAIQQATQPAAVTDELLRPEDINVEVVMKQTSGFDPVRTQGVRVTHKPTGISVTCDAARSQHTNRHHAFEQLRAILALRPVQVPMTEDQVWHNDALMSANSIAGFKMDALMRIVRAVEAHHGITAQAKKEGV